MRMLHVGWGYRPLRYGGVIVYVEDLLQALAARGHEVHYFCSGRSDLTFVPHVKTCTKQGIRFHELRNPPTWVTPLKGTRQPELDVEAPRARRLFRRVLHTVRPQIVHIHEFYGLPARIVEDVKAAGARLVITLEDLHCLCPTFLLYRERQGENCQDYQEGKACVECCREAPADTARMRLKSALWHTTRPMRERAPAFYQGLRRIGHAALHAWDRLNRSNGNGHGGPLDSGALAAGYRFRRAEFVRLLNQADVLHGLSSSLCGIHREHGVAGDRLHRLGTTVAAISNIRPTAYQARRPLVFGFRGYFTKGKGGEALLEAFRGISPDKAILHIHGFLDPALEGAVRDAEARGEVRAHGPYARGQLQKILDATDVGVVPSVWREGYPLVSLEFLAAQIPVIGSRIGGIPDIVSDGGNGLLVPPGDAQALRTAVERFLADPGLIPQLRKRIAPVKTMEEHAKEVEAFYA